MEEKEKREIKREEKSKERKRRQYKGVLYFKNCHSYL